MTLEEFMKLFGDEYVSRDEEWRIGGMEGGSCWGTEPDQPVYADEEPDFFGLSDFISKYFPNMREATWRKFTQECVTYGEQTSYEYYGNYYHYRYKRYDPVDLYNVLISEESNKTIFSVVKEYSSKIKDGRTLQDVLTHATTELGELAQEIQIVKGKSYKKPGKDGIVGECLDLIACAIDVIALRYPNLNEEYLISLLEEKMKKVVNESNYGCRTSG
jgi:hypothetical protein